MAFCFCRSVKQISDQQPARLVWKISLLLRGQMIYIVLTVILFGTIRAFQSPPTKWANFSKAMKTIVMTFDMWPWLFWIETILFPRKWQLVEKLESQNDYHFFSSCLSKTWIYVPSKFELGFTIYIYDCCIHGSDSIAPSRSFLLTFLKS